MDQPAAAQDMINRFMSNKALADEEDSVQNTGSLKQKQQQAVTGGVRQSLRLPAADSAQAVV